MSLTFRPANPADAPAAGGLILATMGAMGAVIFGDGDAPRAARNLAALFAFPDNRFSCRRTLLAEVDGQAAGLLLAFPGAEIGRLEQPLLRQMPPLFSFPELLRLAWNFLPLMHGLETEKDEYYIAHIAVMPEYRGRGIGRALLLLAEGQCRRAGLQKCSLNVDFGNDGARRLYLSLGYGVVEKHTNPPGVARRLKWEGYERMVKKITYGVG